MDMVVAVASSWVSDGHGSCFGVNVAGMRWKDLVVLDCHFVS